MHPGKHILIFSLFTTALSAFSFSSYGQGCGSDPSGGCASGVSGQRCSAGHGNFGLCTPTDDNSSCDCQSATSGAYTLVVGPPVPSAVRPGDPSTFTVTVSSVSQPALNSFFQDLVNLSCTTHVPLGGNPSGTSCRLNPSQVYVSGDSRTAQLTVSTSAGTPAGSFSIEVDAASVAGRIPPQNKDQIVSLSVSQPSGGGVISVVIFLGLLLLRLGYRWRWRAREGSR